MLVTSFAFYPATFACEVSVSIDWALLSVYSSMSQTHRDDAGIVECGDELDCCASLQQSAEELAPTQLCASRGIWCVNCEDGVGASDQLLRIVDARRRRCRSVPGAEHPHPRRVLQRHRFHWPSIAAHWRGSRPPASRRAQSP